MQEQVAVPQLRNASRAFKKQTAITDGWHPRQFKVLTDDALSGLARLISLMEFAGRLPAHLNYVLIKQFPKPTGG